MKFVIAFLCLTLFYAEIDISLVRRLYEHVAHSEQKNTELISLLEKQSDGTALCHGYKGAATMTMAKHTANPFKKMNYFNEGRHILENAIAKEPANAELRYLRFSVQTNCPSFLNYAMNIEEDKLFLIQSLKGMSDGNLKKIITSFLLNSSCLSKAEKQNL